MKDSRGFTLIEVMIVVVIVGILAAVAYPSYSEYIKRGYRAEGMALLNDAAARQERYFAQSNSYITSTSSLGELGLTVTSDTVASTNDRYTLSVAGGSGGYMLTATPTFSDSQCGNLTLTATGSRGSSAGSVDNCWR
jgi:type IV pilus assembly protein PilE